MIEKLKEGFPEKDWKTWSNRNFETDEMDILLSYYNDAIQPIAPTWETMVSVRCRIDDGHGAPFTYPIMQIYLVPRNEDMPVYPLPHPINYGTYDLFIEALAEEVKKVLPDPPEEWETPEVLMHVTTWDDGYSFSIAINDWLDRDANSEQILRIVDDNWARTQMEEECLNWYRHGCDDTVCGMDSYLEEHEDPLRRFTYTTRVDRDALAAWIAKNRPDFLEDRPHLKEGPSEKGG